ncbi:MULTISPECIES: beta-ketoacyl synthase N-terminal-like domain-containing protein [Enterobacter cloacae complex]|uniref:beta-ketoacyl synthase N-terminal-like domain-containing protein n=1 Tax=Enterobacter cloacae complex TaxID=354276 RepID=UPI000794FAFA|nr:beta-ketoacyl synthase N-terminal-like domain-containing protein [Enterobacter ludwigii]WNI43100.1 beta-ketoacyl synthase N-terminal-like domain-containing protein [Enterobacter ludwigii]WNI52151.1 beta-ketoacyl synthase N-terminal-like domain-containing protein [Enterobacter ludwigii]WNI83927.1 beta-ketoacyl synthase N-terminal-like domain-containing protein [Enterobacter ludwigii]SAC79222.1 6-deoxyerythronolide-B synthase%2C Glutamate-1-semialdehyde 2%2C1-aminomutase [Enterobacter ludwigii
MNGLIHEVKKIIAEVTSFPVDELNIDSNLVDYGFDSISLTRLANRIYAQLGLETTPAILIEHKTINDIARHLETLQPHQLQDTTVAPSGLPEEPEKSPFFPDVPAYDNLFTADNSRPVSRSEESGSRTVSEDIAIIGLSGEFAGAADPEALWEMLVNGRVGVTSPPDARNQLFVNEKEFAHGWPDYKTAFINDIDKFDAEFFNISPREARHLDPQQRLLLKHSWIALEEAGCNIEELADKRVGVFVGISTADYRTIMESVGMFDSHYTTGIAHTMASNRISWYLGLTGPSVVIDTACSSSLVALHQAVTAIKNNECEMAIVGAANAILHPGISHACMQAGMLSKSGACHTFDADADGYVRGEGCGVIIIKSMKQAAIDRDTIHAVIKGTATNHGGRARSLTVPNSDAQAEVIAAALQQAQLSPGDLSYIEAHGTGTRIGDPVEINGLKHLRQASSSPDDLKCAIGSIKGNVGHLEAAAGMAGVIKTILMFRHRTLPKNATFHTMNPYIDLRNSSYFIIDKTQPWQTGGRPRYAGVSSFGIGGSNAHAILQEPDMLPYTEPESSEKNHWCLFSAPGMQQLQYHVSSVIDYLESHTDTPVARLSYNLRRKKSHQLRLAVMASDTTELVNKLKCWMRQPGNSEGVLTGADPRTQEFVRLSSGMGISAEDLSDFFISKKNTTTLINLWLSGLTVRWSSLFPEKYRGITLPCRPFNPQPYWIDLSAHTTLCHQPSAGESCENKPDVAPANERKIVLPLPEHYQHPIPAAVTPLSKMVLVEPGHSTGPSSGEEPQLQMPTYRTLAGLLSSVLECSAASVDEEKTFSEMGLDSILAVEFVGKVSQQFALPLNASMLYEHVNLRQFAGYIDGLLVPEKKGDIFSPAKVLSTNEAPPTKVNVLSNITDADARDTLKRLLADTLGTEPSHLHEDKSFSEMGLDSILGMEFISKVNRQFGTDLKADSLYEHVCLSQLLPHVTTSPSAVESPDAIDNILHQVWKGTLSMDEAGKQLSGAVHD